MILLNEQWIFPKFAVFMDPSGSIVPVTISKKSLFGVIT